MTGLSLDVVSMSAYVVSRMLNYLYLPNHSLLIEEWQDGYICVIPNVDISKSLTREVFKEKLH